MNEETDVQKISKLLDYDPHLAAQLYKGLGYDFNDFSNQIIGWYNMYTNRSRLHRHTFYELNILETEFKSKLRKNKKYNLKEIISILNDSFCYANRKVVLEYWLEQYWK